MLTKKRISIVSILGVFAIGLAILFSPKPNPRDTDKAAIRGHIENILSLSGKLTDAEKQIYFDNYFALGKYELAPDEELTDFATPEEIERLQKHVQALYRENPDLELPPHSHAHGPGHEHVYQQHAEKQAKKQAELTHINEAIADVKASDAPEGAKAAILSILNHRRGVLMDDGTRAREMDQILNEIIKTEPDVVGLNWDGREYKRIYANQLAINKVREHYPDGTIHEHYRGGTYGAADPKLGQAIEKHIEALENTPPWETPPEPPQHPDLHYTVAYEDIYLDSEGKEIPNPAEQTSEPPDDTGDTSETAQTTDPSTETLSEFAQEYPEPRITEEEVTSWQEELRALEAAEREELRALFEKGVGIPLDQFMEMSDAELEAEFQIEKELEKHVGAPQTAPPPGNDMESSLQEKYSTFRFRRAMATLNHHGPEEGIRRLQEIDPEIAADLKKFQQQQEE